MSEQKELMIPVPINIVRKEAKYSRVMKQILNKFIRENNLPGSQVNLEVSFNHNKIYEEEEKKKKLAELQKEVAPEAPAADTGKTEEVAPEGTETSKKKKSK